MLDLLVDKYCEFLDWKEFLSPTSTKEEFQEFHRFRHKKDDALEGGHTPDVGPVMDCEGVGLSGWDDSVDVWTGVSSCNWPKPCARLVGC